MGSKSATGVSGTAGTNGGAGQPGGPGQSLYNNTYGVSTDSSNYLVYTGGNGGQGGTGGAGGAAGAGGAGGVASAGVQTTLSSGSSTYARARAFGGSGGGARTPGSGGGGANGGGPAARRPLWRATPIRRARMLAEKPRLVAAIALGNKMARSV